jgi:hypothetical protein
VKQIIGNVCVFEISLSQKKSEKSQQISSFRTSNKRALFQSDHCSEFSFHIPQQISSFRTSDKRPLFWVLISYSPTTQFDKWPALIMTSRNLLLHAQTIFNTIFRYLQKPLQIFFDCISLFRYWIIQKASFDTGTISQNTSCSHVQYHKWVFALISLFDHIAITPDYSMGDILKYSPAPPCHAPNPTLYEENYK